MAILDLQAMQVPSGESNRKPNNSGASKGCGNTSTLSLLLC
jgi:hypothetical protein